MKKSVLVTALVATLGLTACSEEAKQETESAAKSVQKEVKTQAQKAKDLSKEGFENANIGKIAPADTKQETPAKAASTKAANTDTAPDDEDWEV